MNVPASLTNTTLGDVFGTLYRSRESCVLELRESIRGAERCHYVYVFRGLVCAVDTPLPGRPLAAIMQRLGFIGREDVEMLLDAHAYLDADRTRELLIAKGRVTTENLQAATTSYLRSKLDALFYVENANVRVLPAAAIPRGVPRLGPLLPEHFLYGRPRHRDKRSKSIEQLRAATLGQLRRKDSKVNPKIDQLSKVLSGAMVAREVPKTQGATTMLPPPPAPAFVNDIYAPTAELRSMAAMMARQIYAQSPLTAAEQIAIDAAMAGASTDESRSADEVLRKAFSGFGMRSHHRQLPS